MHVCGVLHTWCTSRLSQTRAPTIARTAELEEQSQAQNERACGVLFLLLGLGLIVLLFLGEESRPRRFVQQAAQPANDGQVGLAEGFRVVVVLVAGLGCRHVDTCRHT